MVSGKAREGLRSSSKAKDHVGMISLSLGCMGKEIEG